MTDRIYADLVDKITTLLLVRSGGHFEAVRDQTDEKIRGDAEAVVSLVFRELERESRVDRVTLTRAEFEELFRARGFTRFVAVLDKPIGEYTRRKITLEKLIAKAQAALAGRDTDA